MKKIREENPDIPNFKKARLVDLRLLHANRKLLKKVKAEMAYNPENPTLELSKQHNPIVLQRKLQKKLAAKQKPVQPS